MAGGQIRDYSLLTFKRKVKIYLINFIGNFEHFEYFINPYLTFWMNDKFRYTNVFNSLINKE